MKGAECANEVIEIHCEIAAPAQVCSWHKAGIFGAAASRSAY